MPSLISAMAPISLWLLFPIFLQVEAVRQSALSTIQTDLAARTENQAKLAQITVRKQHAIAGHTSLNAMTVYGVQADDGECSKVIKIVSDFAREQLAVSSESGQKIDREVDEAWLHDGVAQGPRELFGAFAVLDQSDLRDVMRTGEVWTLGDQDTLIKCETNQSIRVEEESQTDEGTALLQGDMLAPENEKSGSLLEMKTGIAKGASWFGQTWPKDDKGQTQIAYCFDPTLHEEAKVAFRKAIEHTELQVPCLNFIDVGYTESSQDQVHWLYSWATQKVELVKQWFGGVQKGKPNSCSVVPSVKIQDTDKEGCWSHVGMQHSFLSKAESQPLNLGKWCQTMAVAAHELGHTLGMLHTQSGFYRDDFITVHWDNIAKDKRNNFEKSSRPPDYRNLGLGYDPFSLMHYDSKGFAINPKEPTLTATAPSLTRLFGQRTGWSEEDITSLGYQYCWDEASWDSWDEAPKVKPFVKQTKMLERIAPVDWNCVQSACENAGCKGNPFSHRWCSCRVTNNCWRIVQIVCEDETGERKIRDILPRGETEDMNISFQFCSPSKMILS